MQSISFSLSSREETEKFGIALGVSASPGDVICLDGDLGAGKTTLSQYIAKGIEVPADCYVTSPSFAIFHEYPGRIPMYHMDFYRLGDAAEVEDLGFEEYFYLSGLTVIEWAIRAQEILPEGRLHIMLEVSGDESRKVQCLFSEARWRLLLEKALSDAGISHD